MSWFRRIRNVFQSNSVQREIDRELSFHISERTDELQAEGMSREEAVRQAHRRFGNFTAQTETTRDTNVAVRLGDPTGCSLFGADAGESSGIHDNGGADAGAGNRRQQRGVFRHPCSSSPASAISGR